MSQDTHGCMPEQFLAHGLVALRTACTTRACARPYAHQTYAKALRAPDLRLKSQRNL
jgi:hypothetical protein